MVRRVAIIGGGLAGIAAAIRLAGHGVKPILIETKRKLGGRATSFVDPRSGHVLDNCQHVLLGCCTNLIDLYDRLGVLDSIEWHRTLFWTKGRGRIDRLKSGWWPSPFHLTGSFWRMSLFTCAQKLLIARGMWAMIRLRPAGAAAWRDRTFKQFLLEHEQSEEVISRFWNVIIVSACNLDVARVAAVHGLQVFRQGFLANRWSSVVGVPTIPLHGLYEDVPQLVNDAGGEVRLGESAKAIAFDHGRVTGVVTEAGLIEVGAVIAAVPFDRLEKLASDPMRVADARLQSLASFEVSPILGVHLRFDRRIMDEPHLVLVGGGVQWLFNKGVDAEGRQHLHAVISGADEWMDLDELAIVARVVADIHRAVPASVGLQPIEARAVKEKRATFAATPEIEPLRPSAAPGFVGLGGGGIANLFLAGDWTDTGWPATMEGAVRSGYAAAAAAVGDRTGGLVSEVPPGWLAAMLGMRDGG